MLCPICKSELIITGQKRLTSMTESVVGVRIPSFKNAFQCLNPSCSAIQYDLIWDEYGALYTNPRDSKFIDNNNAPFGTFQRKCNIEVYKHDEDFYLFRIGMTGLKVSFHYKSNEDGEVLSRKWKLNWIWKGIYYISGVRMLFFTISHFYTRKKYFLEHRTEYGKKELAEYYNLPTWEKRWWKKLSSLYVKLFYSKLLQKETNQ